MLNQFLYIFGIALAILTQKDLNTINSKYTTYLFLPITHRFS